jgi:hypothetical protein
MTSLWVVNKSDGLNWPQFLPIRRLDAALLQKSVEDIISYSLLARRHHWFFRYLSRWPVLSSSLMIRVYVGDVNVDISHDSLIIRQHRRVSSYPIWKLKATHTALSVFRWFVSLGFTNKNSKSREHKGLLPPVLNVCLWIILRWFLLFFKNLLFKFLVAIGRFRRYEIVSWNALNCFFYFCSLMLGRMRKWPRRRAE